MWFTERTLHTKVATTVPMKVTTMGEVNAGLFRERREGGKENDKKGRV